MEEDTNMPTTFFTNFQNVPYSFGDNETPVFAKKLSQYVSVLDQLRNSETLIEKYTVIAGDRPDTISFRLYGTVDYYWTFFLMNEHIRESGWSVPSYDLLAESKIRYPHRTVTTNQDISTDNGSYELFPVGVTVTGVTSSTTGTIIRKIPDMGQIIIKPTVAGTEFLPTEELKFGPVDGEKKVRLVKESAQYDSVHHYEDADGVYQDLTPTFSFTSDSPPLPTDWITPNVNWTAVTYRDRLEKKNLELQQIVVVKPSAISGFVSEFKTLMKQRL
jgi:hypothetical protein